jgi:GNAT superfamily N-acetyltransferase
MRRRQADVTDRGLPYLVAARDAEVLGFGYCAPYRARSAYRYALEDSVYIRDGSTGQGLGSKLLAELIGRCERLDYRPSTEPLTANMLVCTVISAMASTIFSIFRPTPPSRVTVDTLL